MLTKNKELNDTMAYQTEIAGKLEEAMKALSDIGDINGKPTTFYESAKEAYEHRNNVDNLKSALSNKETEVILEGKGLIVN